MMDFKTENQLRQKIDELWTMYQSTKEAYIEAKKHAEELRQVVRELAALNAWHHFGECRAWVTGPIISPHEADEMVRRVLRT